MSTLGTAQTLAATVVVPKAGDFRAADLLDNAPLPIGAMKLTIGDLALKCSVLRSDFDAAGRPHAVVVGGIGWHGVRAVPVSFESSAGVRLSTVLAALSKNSGQPIEQPPDRA